MDKLVKVIVCGALGTNGRLNASAQETVALYVDPYQAMRAAVVEACKQRFAWLEFVPLDQVKMHWIDAEGDRISIYTESDMEICVERGGAIPKIYIVISQPEQQQAPAAVDDPITISTSTAAAQTDAGSAATAAAADAGNNGGQLHPNVICDGCDGAVRGVRFKCAQCADFDLCNRCEQLGRHSHHMMYRMAEPMPELSTHIERRLSKWLRKHMPTPSAATAAGTESASSTTPAGNAQHSHPQHPSLIGGCRRNGGGGRRHCNSSRWPLADELYGSYHHHAVPPTAPVPTARTSNSSASSATPATAPPQPQTQQPRLSADHIAEALSQARTAEKAASAGLDLLSKFSSLLDPFGAHLNGAAAGAGGAAGATGCPFEAVAKVVGSVAANVAEVAAAASAAAAAAASSTASPTFEQQPEQPEQQSANNDATAAASTVPAAAAAEPRPPTAPASPARSDDFEHVSMRSAESMDSVLEDLIEATKDGKNAFQIKPEPDVD